MFPETDKLNEDNITLTDKRKFMHSLVFPIFFALILWSVKIVELGTDVSFGFLGIYPMKIQGLIGIITAPLIHENFKHLINNTIPFLILCTGHFIFTGLWGIKFSSLPGS